MQIVEKPQRRVLVTGGAGYLASHIIALLLKKNYHVRTTVRSLKKSEKYTHLLTLSPNAKTHLEIVEANLLSPSDCVYASRDCMVVFHVASTFPPKMPKDESKLIKPAVQMTLNLLSASIKNGIKKFILTSSVLAVMVGNENIICNEDSWSSEVACMPYEKSKLLTEQAAWKFYEQHKGEIEFSVLCPGLLWGPVLGQRKFKSGELVQSIMNNQLQAVPNLTFPIVDVRDAATAHIRVMERRETNGKRYIIVSDSISGEAVMDILRDEFSQYGYRFPKLKIGRTFARIVAIFNPMFKILMSAIGTRYELSNKRSVDELGMDYIKVSVSLLEMVYSMIERRIIPDRRAIRPKL